MKRVILISAVLVAVTSTGASTRTWYIMPDGSGDAPTIQAGIDSAAVGDTVLVAAGTYTGVGNKDLDFGGTDLVLLSEAGPEMTIIDCQGSGLGFYFHNHESQAAVVEGLSVWNGNTVAGGGVVIAGSSPILVNCTFYAGSVRDYGGGIHCSLESSPTLIDCAILENSVLFGGACTALILLRHLAVAHSLTIQLLATVVGCVFTTRLRYSLTAWSPKTAPQRVVDCHAKTSVLRR